METRSTERSSRRLRVNNGKRITNSIKEGLLIKVLKVMMVSYMSREWSIYLLNIDDQS